MEVTKGTKSKVWVSKVNDEKLKKKIQTNDTIIRVNSKRIGNDVSALQSTIRPLYIEFARVVSVEVIEDDDETIEDHTDEELTNNEDLPKRTGIDNSDIGSSDGDESIDSTEEELRKIIEKETNKEEEEEDDD